MIDDIQLVNLTISEAMTLIAGGQISPLELVEAYLARIDRLNSSLNAFLCVMRESAIEEAGYASDAVRRGENWGPLHGIPIAIKDIIDVAGERTTAGSDFLRDNCAQEDADIVRRLRAAGAIIIGKTHLHEFAIGATTINPHYGPARNPWDTNCSPGGSSGGSGAAVSASMCLGAIGTDTGGSVRVPSALCGLTGIRPGKGRISTEGVIPMSWTLDTVGPMAYTARDVAIIVDMLDVQPLTPASCLDRLDEPVSGLRIGVPIDDFFWLETDYQVVGAVRAAVDRLSDMGLSIVEVQFSMIEEVLQASQIISLADAVAFHQDRLRDEPERFGKDVRSRLQIGSQPSAPDYAVSRQAGREWRRILRELFRDSIDVLIVPTTPIPAPKIAGAQSVELGRTLLRFTYPFSLSHLPVLSVPCGFTSDDLPIGMQMIALSEGMVLRVAHAYQQATPWHTQRPVL
ncbi:MAG: amidase [Anaerolineae bacterium]|nr:amidase [Anaerolineae bacterium]